jgi:Tol biopolymer transport system component
VCQGAFDQAELSGSAPILTAQLALTPGTRLGVYDITAAIGEGGMGQVYRATDAKLKRQVAIKVLPPSLAVDADRLARFQREAEVLASLNHPNIAAIYDLEESGGITALVMELVEGDDLSKRIARGAMPLDEALPIARQIAQALEAAHEQGIVHRDLKPANIKVRGDGAVKVLDFGLAKAMDPAGASSAVAANSPTLTAHATALGMILGTAAYMAPEQAKGKAVDKRADIWAFGVVLYEMLAGRAAFAGDTVTDIIAAVVTREPEWTALPADTPASIRRVLARCLEKDSKRRVRDIGDVRFEIDETIARGSSDARSGESGSGPARLAGATRAGKLAWTVLWAVLSASLAAGLAWSGVWPRARPSESRPLRVSIVHTEGSEVGAPAISPDGRRVAYRARRGDGMPLLWVRDLASGESQSLPGTEDATMPFWSPDSRDLGFFAGAALKRVSAAGGPVRLVTGNVGPWTGYGGTWAADGTLVIGRQAGLFRVPADGGAMTAVTKLPSQDWAHDWPSFLPDGRRFLFTAKLFTRTAEASEQGIYLGSLDSPKIERLLPDLSSAVYASPGYIVFAREGTLAAAPFDLAAGRVTGPPIAIGGAVATDAQFYVAGISASADGTLAVRPPPAVVFPDSDTLDAELRLVNRSGTGSRAASARLFSYGMALSPTRSGILATPIIDPRAGTQDLWVMDLSTDRSDPLTTTRGYTGNPVWSADGNRLAYTYQPPGQIDDVYVKDIGTGAIQPVIESPRSGEHPVAWSHDGRSLLVFTYDDDKANLSLWSFASRTLTRFVGPGALECAAFSPRDDYVAFGSQESGRPEVYVTTFPDHRQTWRLTTEGGRVLSWSNDGREILVATLAGHIVGYPVSTDGGLSYGQPKTLVRDVGAAAEYSAATRDHSHILIRVSPDAAKDKGEIRLLFGWQDALRQAKE